MAFLLLFYLELVVLVTIVAVSRSSRIGRPAIPAIQVVNGDIAFRGIDDPPGFGISVWKRQVPVPIEDAADEPQAPINGVEVDKFVCRMRREISAAQVGHGAGHPDLLERHHVGH